MQCRYKKRTIVISDLLIGLLTIFAINDNTLWAQDLMCCSQVAGSCRIACDKISLAQFAADAQLRNDMLQEVYRWCSPGLSGLEQFWQCLNGTIAEIDRGSSWFGRTCCPLPQSETCRRACITATSNADLLHGCRQSDEIEFFNCLERQETGESCCSASRSEECLSACMNIFKSHLTPTKHQRNLVAVACSSNQKVLNCVKDFTKVTPATNMQKHIKCCDQSNKSKCRESCKSLLTTTSTHQELIDGLQIGGCGPPLLHEPFWQCFLKPIESITSTSVEVSRIDKVGMDSAKSHCCQRASNATCRKLCLKTFTNDWSTTWHDFQTRCFNEIAEEPLLTCLDEVDKPCELGCDGLSFCTNFNNRPTELFRSCNSVADETARNGVTLWQSQNELYLPGFTLPLKNITRCSPNMWKAVACTLQIKPCSRLSHGNQICRDVCLDILSQCVDWTRVSAVNSPDSICSLISPRDNNNGASCITLDQYLAPSRNPYKRVDGRVSSPCKGDPCEPGEICTVNRNCAPGHRCLPFACTRGCKLGEVSEYVVPDGAYVRIPIPKNPKGCLQICKCADGQFEQCQPLPCVVLSPCWLGNTQKEHGTSFSLECKACSCYAGELICSKRQCESTALSGHNAGYTTLPCNCPPHYLPVCGRNGNNYPSICLAKCAGLNDSDIDNEPCKDPCRNNPCPVGQKCVPDPTVCLTLMQKPCTQYQCVNGTTNCRHLPLDPVCDVENRVYDNACQLAHNNAKLAYRGKCLKRCRHKGEVCGINGKTYVSECGALADSVRVDYDGRCVAIGLITDKKTIRCSSVTCPPLPKTDCLGVTPPGACCPVCGGALRILFSNKQLDRALYALKDKDTYPLTLRALLDALNRQIQVAQCVLRGYLTIEQDLFVLVETTESYPSDLQMEACVREAEKIASLVNRQSPRVVSELSLSCLTAATVVHTQSNAAFRCHLCRDFHFLAIALITLLLLLR